MYLKRLDILGFKSFANKTLVQFSPGMTAIVGPNGCGKTNILDALRWVLGEQKVTLLRGAKMEEVIFNGTRDVKPLGMAEVTLTVVNNRGVLPTEYTEVQVTRRLFRSGESEYLLNKVPCRRKDIIELFFDTGMGAHSYSVIQQDMVDAVISDKAEERRFLFEEAAGITKYKQRKRAALRKLEATENDLLRLRDIHSEVLTRVRSLNRQQKKAQRYQNVVNDIKSWELFLGANRLKQIEDDKRQLKSELNSLEDKRLEQQTLLDKITAQLEKDRHEQVELEQDLTTIGNDVYQVSEQAHGLETEISILVEKRSNGRATIDRNQDDIEALKGRSAILIEQAKESEAELNRLRETHEKLAEELLQAEQTQAEADRLLLGARSGREDENSQLLELEGKLSSGRTTEDNLHRQDEELGQLISDLESQIDHNESARKALQGEISNHTDRLDKLREEKQDGEHRRQEAQQRIEDNTQAAEDLSLRISDLTASIEACQARQTLLEEMILHYEGYSSGVVAVMDVRDRFDGVSGTVAEKFVPREGYEVAVEAALGEMAGFLVCDTRATAEKIVGYLKSERKGRVGVLVPDAGTINPVSKRPIIDVPGFVGWLDDFVSVEDELRPLMQAVLARMAAFEAGADPSPILERLPFGFSAVSTDGVVYSKNVISGGSEDSLPLFRRQEKVDEQKQLIVGFEDQLAQAKGEKDRLTAQLAADRAESSRLTELIESLAEEFSSGREKASELEVRRQSLESENDRLQAEKRRHAERREQVKHQQYSLGLDFNQLADRKSNLVDSITRSDENLQDRERAAAEALDRVSKLQVAQVESRSRTEQAESRIAHLKELQQEISNTIEAKQNEIERADREIESSRVRIDELEEELKKVFSLRSEATERQATLHGSQAEIQECVTAREQQLRQAQTEKEGLSERLHQAEIRSNTLESEIRSLAERVREEYDQELDQVQVARPDDTKDDEAARRHLAEQKEKLRQFGAVNLLALEEYKEAVERESFLKEQLDDLTNAKDDLTSTIGRINKRAREMFNETFAQVKKNFQKLFVELFTGGEADIFLEDPSNPLESDIDIIARPRGKKLLSITMMSGGERALTAISLLFSLYLVKPSPFCILDEIDAPLDDANCHRFLNIIDSFSGQTQFVVITHNKITMESANNLYGVTMEHAGISSLVAVRFSDVREGSSPNEVVIDTSETEADEPDRVAPPEAPADLPGPVTERLEAPVTLSGDPKTDN